MRWWVVFTGRDRRNWWDVFTVPGYRHCFAFCQWRPGEVYIIEPMQEALFAHVELHEHVLDVVERALKRGMVLEFEHEPMVSGIGFRLRDRAPLLTCASVIGYTLGLRAWVLTPQGLARRLLKEGAKRVSVVEDHRADSLPRYASGRM
ncbi:MAG: hypothetical protein QNJ94_18755 [Alphaproteobacteria bacterium]|nr:hypothetical protein [Alphaproteobacteria bacterium]